MMTNTVFRAIRERLGLSTAQMGDALKIDARTVRRLEEGSRPVSGPVDVLMMVFSTGRIPTLPKGKGGRSDLATSSGAG